MSTTIKELNPEELSAQESIKKYRITRLVGFSMYPTLQENDVLFLEVVPPEKIRVGDLIIFESDLKDKTICHRVVGKKFKNNQWFFKEKGDNCFGGSLVSQGRVIARVKDYYRGRQHFFAYHPLLARFNILMALVFKVVYAGRALKKKLLPNWRIGFWFKPFFRGLGRLNRIGNRHLHKLSKKTCEPACRTGR